MKLPLIPGLKIAILAIGSAPIMNMTMADELVTFQYDVYPTFILIDGNPASNLNVDGPESLAERTQRYLESCGITFGDGASADFAPESSTLIVTNLTEQIELVDVLLHTLHTVPHDSGWKPNKTAVRRTNN